MKTYYGHVIFEVRIEAENGMAAEQACNQIEIHCPTAFRGSGPYGEYSIQVLESKSSFKKSEKKRKSS